LPTIFPLLMLGYLLLLSPFALYKYIKGKGYKRKYGWVYPVLYLYLIAVSFITGLGLPIYVVLILLLVTAPIYVIIETYGKEALEEEEKENNQEKEEDKNEKDKTP
jgi:Na+-transporting methylmalonyl-CoA/oxaloacetate decarboxylase gamma subunit